MLEHIPRASCGQHDNISILTDKKDKSDLYKVTSDLQTTIVIVKSISTRKIRGQISKDATT